MCAKLILFCCNTFHNLYATTWSSPLLCQLQTEVRKRPLSTCVGSCNVWIGIISGPLKGISEIHLANIHPMNKNKDIAAAASFFIGENNELQYM